MITPRGVPTSAMATVAVCLTVVLSACGNAIDITDAGQLGISVDEAGHPVIAVVTCTTSRPVISMFEGRKPTDPDSKPNVARGSWRARRAFSGVAKLSLTAPGQSWKTTSESGVLEPGQLFLVDGGTVEDDSASLGGVDFRPADLARLSPTQVRVNGKVTSWRAFGRYRCS
jgi:hypothetical protein